jgi:hypothetical protein
MNSNPMLSERQWKLVSALLPENRRNQSMVEAVLFREFSGQSITEISWQFGTTRAKLHAWTHALAADLPEVMAALKLEPSRARGKVFYGNGTAQAAEIASLRIGNFREALRGRR